MHQTGVILALRANRRSRKICAALEDTHNNQLLDKRSDIVGVAGWQPLATKCSSIIKRDFFQNPLRFFL
jgi:hypothetical protein